MSRNGQTKQRRFPGLVGAGLTLLITWVVLATPFWPGLRNLSYDLPFRFRPDISVGHDDVMIVYMDDESHQVLSEPYVRLWKRSLHAQLIKWLTAAQARVIAFDVFFQNADTNNPAADEEVLYAAQAHGKVLFAAVTGSEKHPAGEKIGQHVQRPFSGLENPGRFPCLTNLDCIGLIEEGPEQTMRRHYSGTRQVGTLAWKCAQWTMADPPRDPLTPRWLNHYRAMDAFPHVSFHRLLSNSLPPSITLSNRVVFVGARTTRGPTAGTGTDWKRTPYGTLVPGVDIIATTYLNLLRGDWLRGLSPLAESIVFTLLAILFGYGLAMVPPMRAAILGLGGVAAICLLNYILFANAHWWFAWMLPCTVQIPAAMAWSILNHTRRLARENESLAQALAPINPYSAETMIETDAAPHTVSDHTLLRVIGRGAYAQVWLARNVVGLYRAVKIVSRNAFDKAEPYEREFRGIQHYLPISLNHPGLVRVLHVGRNDAGGYFYSIMELADDEVSGQQINPDSYQPLNLAREIARKGRIPAVDCVRIFCALAEALEYLHQQQLIHRDIKPSNIILVRGAPKLADIGLVTNVSTPNKAVTQLGTEGFMAPEGPGTPAADVYSLGKVLYEACMGQDRELFPEFPTTWLERPDHALLVELNKILGKACMNDPRMRYASAAQMQTDLVRLQVG